MKETYRLLTPDEVAQLRNQGCEAEDWNRVRFSGEDPASLDRIRNVQFSGTVQFGRFSGDFPLPGGIRKRAGIRDASLHNVTVGDGCYISNVSTIDTQGHPNYGQGHTIAVLNEVGDGNLLLLNELNSQLAALTTSR